MILAIDVGNTNIVLGVFAERELRCHWRLSTNRQATADEYGMQLLALFRHAELDIADIEGIIISTVVPPLVFVLEQMCEKYLPVQPQFVGPGIRTGLNLKIDNPREVGADRIVNAVAAIESYGYPLIIVDFGTATTVCGIDEQGNYLGGAIAPGIGISTEALYQRAAKLPRIELTAPPHAIGKNTLHAMQVGIIYGFAGQVDGIIERMIPTFSVKPRIVATGGLAELIAGESRLIETVDPNLTIKGLRILYERQR
jgi:type III pantothenate kinase